MIFNLKVFSVFPPLKNHFKSKILVENKQNSEQFVDANKSTIKKDSPRKINHPTIKNISSSFINKLNDLYANRKCCLNIDNKEPLKQPVEVKKRKRSSNFLFQNKLEFYEKLSKKIKFD